MSSSFTKRSPVCKHHADNDNDHATAYVMFRETIEFRFQARHRMSSSQSQSQAERRCLTYREARSTTTSGSPTQSLRLLDELNEMFLLLRDFRCLIGEVIGQPNHVSSGIIPIHSLVACMMELLEFFLLSTTAVILLANSALLYPLHLPSTWMFRFLARSSPRRLFLSPQILWRDC